MVIAMSQRCSPLRTEFRFRRFRALRLLLVQRKLLRRALVAAMGLSSVAAAGTWSLCCAAA